MAVQRGSRAAASCRHRTLTESDEPFLEFTSRPLTNGIGGTPPTQLGGGRRQLRRSRALGHRRGPVATRVFRKPAAEGYREAATLARRRGWFPASPLRSSPCDTTSSSWNEPQAAKVDQIGDLTPRHRPNRVLFVLSGLRARAARIWRWNLEMASAASRVTRSPRRASATPGSPSVA